MKAIARPRPNYKLDWRVCPLCTLDYRGTQDGPCPRCLTFPPTSDERLKWMAYVAIAAVVTGLALAIIGLYWLVTR